MTLKLENVVKDGRISDLFKKYAAGQNALANFLFLTEGGNGEHLYKKFIDSKSRTRILLSASDFKTMEGLAKKKKFDEAVKKAKETVTKSMNSGVVKKFEATEDYQKFLLSKDDEFRKTQALLSVITEAVDGAIAYFESAKKQLKDNGVPPQKEFRARIFNSARMRSEKVVLFFQDRMQKDKRFERKAYPELFKKKDAVAALWGEVARMLR